MFDMRRVICHLGNWLTHKNRGLVDLWHDCPRHHRSFNSERCSESSVRGNFDSEGDVVEGRAWDERYLFYVGDYRWVVEVGCRQRSFRD